MTFTNQCIYCILTNQNLPGVGILKLGNLKQFSKALLLQQFSQQPQFLVKSPFHSSFPHWTYYQQTKPVPEQCSV